jgi:hypothetical protein
MHGAVPFFDQDAGVLHLWRRQLGLAPQLHAAPFGGPQSRLCPLDDQAALELHQRPDDMAKQPTRGAFGVYRFGERAEAHTLPFQAFQYPNQMGQRPA